MENDGCCVMSTLAPLSDKVQDRLDHCHHWKYHLLLVFIFLQIFGIASILAFWIIKRNKHKQVRLISQIPVLPADHKSVFTTADTFFSPNDLPEMKPKFSDPDDTVVVNLGKRGYIQGRKIRQDEDSDIVSVQFFGGVRYALPPSRRWGAARRLPSEFSYGSEERPGDCRRRALLCPQPFLDDQGGIHEDCFECNIWTPVEECPAEGWPVMFYIHGGFLQTGSPNNIDPVRLIGETNLKCVLIAPVYRLAVLGFLTSRELAQEAAAQGEPAGNQGFWDQRMALKWAYEHARFFGGNSSNITVAGYSAGSFSVFHQLAHDLYLPLERSIIRQAIMLSNGPGVQPKPLVEIQSQFDQLLVALKIPLTLAPSEKLTRLRRTPTRKLIDASLSTSFHQYRPWHDGRFIQDTLFPDIDSGDFARRMIARNIRLINGECRDEHFLYGKWYTPSDSLESLRRRLEADYPSKACDALVRLYYPDGTLPDGVSDWQDAFGRLYADVQVHMAERGFVNALAQGGAAHLVFRYRIEYRVQCVDMPPKWGVTHGSDMAMWFWGNGASLEMEEKEIVNKALIEPLVEFLNGRDPVGWTVDDDNDEDGDIDTVRNVQRVRRLRSDGEVDCWIDDGELWSMGMKVWDVLKVARTEHASAKL